MIEQILQHLFPLKHHSEKREIRLLSEKQMNACIFRRKKWGFEHLLYDQNVEKEKIILSIFIFSIHITQILQ